MDPYTAPNSKDLKGKRGCLGGGNCVVVGPRNMEADILAKTYVLDEHSPHTPLRGFFLKAFFSQALSASTSRGAEPTYFCTVVSVHQGGAWVLGYLGFDRIFVRGICIGEVSQVLSILSFIEELYYMSWERSRFVVVLP